MNDPGRTSNDRLVRSAAPDPAIVKPVCLFGVGRTGTTIMMHLMAQHRAFAWLSSFHQKMPRWPVFALYSRILDVPWIRPGLPFEWSLLPKPSEGARVLRYLTDSGCRSPSQATIRKYRNYVKSVLRYQGKTRFLQKHTGKPRIEYFTAIFPDARFIHIARDGRAVAYSLTRAHWWKATLESWRWGEMDPGFMQEYIAADREPIVLAAIVWKTIMRDIEQETAELPSDRFMEVRYDRFISNPLETMEKICEFCDVPFDDRFRKRIAAVRLHDSDAKWKEELSARQLDLLQSVLDTTLRRYSFDS